MDSEDIDVAKVQVKFKTHIAKYKVTEKPFQVPVNLNRRGLSQVINHLLGNSTSSAFCSGFSPFVLIEFHKPAH